MRVLILVKKPVKMSYLVAFGRGWSRKVCGRESKGGLAYGLGSDFMMAQAHG